MAEHSSFEADKRYARAIEHVSASRRVLFKGVEISVFTLVIALLILILTQVVARYVIEVSLPWTEETARVVLLWTVMIGAALAMDRHEHYAITLLSEQFRPPVDRFVALLINVIALLFLGVFCFYGIKYAGAGMRTLYMSLGVPRGWGYLALPVGGGLMVATLLMQSVETSLRLLMKDPGTAVGHDRDG